MSETLTPNDVAWCRQQYAILAVGGVWGVPRSGLIFQKVPEPDVLDLFAVMPHDPAMPMDAEELLAYQRADFALIREAFQRAGIEIRDGGLL